LADGDWARVEQVMAAARLAHEYRGGRPLGKVGKDLSLEEGYQAARWTALAMLASLKVALGDLDRVECWLRIFGMVNTDSSFNSYPLVINGFSDLIVEIYGDERGSHARSAIGVEGLPFDLPVEIEAEVLIRL
jgi:enamine deaminase RidA (YjgF/YER057c/UK114 family)